MILYILRHGIAEYRIGQPDPSRRLTSEGKAKLRREVGGIRAFGLKFDAILTSPLPRAAETAQIVADGFGGKPAPRQLPALTAGTAPVEMLAAIAPLLRSPHVMIVGHEPGLSGIASLLLTGSANTARIQLKKCGLMALELTGRARPGNARLLWLLTPRQLRRMRK